MLLILNSCNKESTTQPEYKIEEYIAPTNLNVKNEIIDFLKVAGRIQGVAKSEGELFLEDKDPNEGVWLMEAALNFERYNDFSKEINYKKEYTLNISNKLLPGNIIKMDADDIILKYNDLLSQIIQEEIDERKAKLIDFKVENVTQAYTSVSVLALFGGGDDISGPYDPTPNNPNDFSICNEFYYYDEITDEIIISSTINTEVSNVWDENILNTDLGVSSPEYSFQTGSFSNLFYNTARTTTYFLFPPIPEGGMTTIQDIDGYQVVIPYTNVTIIDEFFILDLFDSNKLLRRAPNPNSLLILEDILDCFGEVVYTIEDNLINSTYIDYALVNAVLSNQREEKGSRLSIESLAFIHYANN